MKTMFIALLGIAVLMPLTTSAQCVKDFVPKSRVEEEVVKVENEWYAVKRMPIRPTHLCRRYFPSKMSAIGTRSR